MKHISLLFISAFCFTLCGCSDSTISSSIQEESSVTFNPFAQMEVGNGEIMDANFGYGLCNPPDQNRFTYQDEMTLDFYIENAAREVDFGLLLYVNGVLQEYAFEDESETQTMAHIVVGQDEKRKFSVTFSPVIGEDDKSFSLSYAVMFHPEFVPQSETVSFGNRYRISAMSFPMTDVSSSCAVQNTLTCNDTESIPEEIISEYYDFDEDGNVIANRLSDAVSLRVEKMSSSDKEDDEKGNTLYPDDSVRIALLGGATESAWRISMYCDHELVRAFDNDYYLDMQTDRNNMSTYTIPMSVIKAAKQQYNSVYFIAAPIGSDGAGNLIKSHTFVFVNE